MNYIKCLKQCQTSGKCSISISDHEEDDDSDNDGSCWLFACNWTNSWTYLCYYASFPGSPWFYLRHLSSLGPSILLYLRGGTLPVPSNLECVASPALRHKTVLTQCLFHRLREPLSVTWISTLCQELSCFPQTGSLGYWCHPGFLLPCRFRIWAAAPSFLIGFSLSIPLGPPCFLLCSGLSPWAMGSMPELYHL